jgi:flagellar M-ring protein FliF
MAQAPGEQFSALIRGFNQLPNPQKIGLVAGLAAVISVAVAAWMWSRTPDYRVLFANVSDRDGGAIVASLSQLNIPYRMAEGGGAILVPESQVYETRLRLASQGLPKGGNVGFELMEGQRFGVSQFQEQVNYQRALEGELGRTIESLAAVHSARVHLAIPRPSVFIREALKPSASVLVHVFSGRSLDAGQVAGIVHLLSSSVPELSPKGVTVVDQRGNLLAGSSAEESPAAGLDPSQLKYRQQVEASYTTRIENILVPLFGEGNVRAQVSALLDFSQVEQTSEEFKPNSNVKDQAIRSQQTSDSQSASPTGPSGVPGALSNQPPGAASAPISGIAPGTGTAAAPAVPTSQQKDATLNFEVDKTIRHVKSEVGQLKRLSAAVVINYRKDVDATGKVSVKALSAQDVAQAGELVRQAIGYSKERGDTVNVSNISFNVPLAEEAPPLPWWRRMAEMLPPFARDMETWKTLFVGALLFYLLFGVLRPVLRDLGRAAEPMAVAAGAEGGLSVRLDDDGRGGAESGMQGGARGENSVNDDIKLVKEAAKQNPKLVATVIKEWVNNDE